MDVSTPRHDGRYHLETPERVVIAYDTAGIGSRALAALIDTLLILVIVTVVFVGVVVGLAFAGGLLVRLSGGATDPRAYVLWILGGVVLLNFLVIWGYYVIFEVAWHGQTPGKRWVGLRVIKDGGYPLGFVDSMIRNIVRLIDFLPFYYMVGMVVMFVDARSRRLGDLAAGTLVVRERRDLRLESLDAPVPAAAATAAGSPIRFIERLTPDDRSLLREYLRRRAALAPAAASGLAERLAATFAAKLDHELDGEPAAAFLARLASEADRTRR